MLVSDLRPLLVEPVSLVVDASTTHLEVLLASEGWKAMYKGRVTPSLQEQFGRDMFNEFSAFIVHVLRRCSAQSANEGAQVAHGAARFRKMAGQDPDGTWFRAVLMVTVPQRRAGGSSSSGVLPVVLSLERKKRKSCPPRWLLGASAPTSCDTIFEDDDDATCSGSSGGEVYEPKASSSPPPSQPAAATASAVLAAAEGKRTVISL